MPLPAHTGTCPVQPCVHVFGRSKESGAPPRYCSLLVSCRGGCVVGSVLEFSGHTLHECAVLRDSLDFCDHTQRTAGSFLYCGLFQPLNLIGLHTKAKLRLFIPSALSPLRPSFKKVGYLERTCRRRTVRATLGSDMRLRRAHHQ